MSCSMFGIGNAELPRRICLEHIQAAGDVHVALRQGVSPPPPFVGPVPLLTAEFMDSHLGEHQ